MNNVKKILIATDGSEHSKKAASEGIGLAKIYGAKVFAVYVMKELSSKTLPYGARITNFDIPHEDIKREGQQALQYVEELGNPQGVAVDTVLLAGYPAEEILDFAKENEIDIIVMGSLGRTGLERYLMGSVSEKVLRHAKTAVMDMQKQR